MRQDAIFGRWQGDSATGEVKFFPLSRDEPCTFTTASGMERLHPDDGAVVTAFAKELNTVEDGKCIAVEFRIPSDLGQWRWILAAGCRAHGVQSSGLFEGIVCDITSAKFKEQRQQEAVQRQAQFVAATSHDLQAPLRHIGMYASILADGLHGVAQENEFKLLKGLEVKVAELQAQVRSVLAFARTAEAPKREKVDLGKVLNQAIGLLSGEIAETGSTIISTSLPSAFGDPDLIAKVFYNLIINSLEHGTPAHAHINVTADTTSGRVAIRLSDNGRGIDEEYQDRIFDPYWSRPRDQRPRGLGLGLTTAKSILFALDGNIELAESGPLGTTFVIDLPASP